MNVTKDLSVIYVNDEYDVTAMKINYGNKLHLQFVNDE